MKQIIKYILKIVKIYCIFVIMFAIMFVTIGLIPSKSYTETIESGWGITLKKPHKKETIYYQFYLGEHESLVILSYRQDEIDEIIMNNDFKTVENSKVSIYINLYFKGSLSEESIKKMNNAFDYEIVTKSGNYYNFVKKHHDRALFIIDYENNKIYVFEYVD